MQPLTAPGRPRAARARWIWRLSGIVTISAIGVFGSSAIVRAANPATGPQPTTALPTRIVTVTQPVTALNV
jgi:hypothetical protein